MSCVTCTTLSNSHPRPSLPIVDDVYIHSLPRDSSPSHTSPADPNALLGELQFAFVCFLLGQVFEGFEQWKQLVALLCHCDDALLQHPRLYLDAIATLHFQLRQTPQDFFVDIVTRSNFLTDSLRNLFSRIEQAQVTPELARRAASFKASVSKHFDWDFSLSADDADDEQPVIVDEADS
eukprot:m.96236 g.96236  ORF g.96236 m.96236 type:complete len:179 (-) comp13929_c0_seq2:101-637(-)